MLDSVGAGFSVTVTVTDMSLSIVAARERRVLKVRALKTGDIATLRTVATWFSVFSDSEITYVPSFYIIFDFLCLMKL